MDEKEKTCFNCKYFKFYYLKKHTTFMKTCNGFCSNTHAVNKSKKRLFERRSCESWQSDETVKTDRKEKIETVLIEMKKKLDDISIMLQSDAADGK